MNAKTVGMIAGGLIVSLALTAGRQFAVAQQWQHHYGECTQSQNTRGQLLQSAQATNTELLETIRVQQAQIDALRAKGLQLHELPSGKVIAIDPNHNEHGGYIAACGSLPGTLGDDC